MIERLLEQLWPVTADPSVTNSVGRSLEFTTEQWKLLAELKPVLCVLQVATTYQSAEYNVSISALLPIIHGLTKSMDATEGDSPPVHQCKCEISLELRWNLDTIDPDNLGSDLVALCLDPWFKEVKFLDSHKPVDLQLTITTPARQAKAHSDSGTQEKETTVVEKRLDLRPKVLDLHILQGSHSPCSSNEGSDPVQDEVEA